MRIVLWHGYLLGGTGSNIYTANLVRVWRRQGHEVLLMCQERDRSFMSDVDEEGDFAPGNDGFSTSPLRIERASGRCVLVRPDIGGLLPVYVYDEYEGFTAKRFVDLSDEELAAYLHSNVAALRAAIGAWEPEAIIVGHEVMGPEIARIAIEGSSYRYLAKLHGSALEYAVKKQERYRRYASSGLNGAARVAGGSEYMVREALKVVPGWEERATIVNPGCDTELFRPRPRRASDAHEIVYVGKLIGSKGVHNLLAALVLTRVKPLHLTIIGFGDLRMTLEEFWSALARRDVSAIDELTAGDPLFADARAALLGSDGRAALQSLDQVAVTFAGRLEHAELAPVLPNFALLVAPSVLPEAFGMVAAEAAAAGVLPVLPRHSGIGEVGRRLESHLGIGGSLTFEPQDPVRSLAERLGSLLSMSEAERGRLSAAAAELARSIWSWEHVADALLTAAR